MEAGLALQSSFSSLPCRSCYPRLRLHQRNPTLHYTRARFGPLHLTGNKHKHSLLEHKNSFLGIAITRRKEFDVAR